MLSETGQRVAKAAFSVPDFLYMLLVEGALSSAFIPYFDHVWPRIKKPRARNRPA